MVIDMDEPMANHKITPALLEMTEEWKKTKLDEIKRQMKAQTSATIVRESWGGDRESASVTSTQKPQAASTAAQPQAAAATTAPEETKIDTTGGGAVNNSRPQRRAKFADTDTVTVSTATATASAGGRFQDTAVVTPQTISQAATTAPSQIPTKFSNVAEVAPATNAEETKTTEERKGFVFSTDDDVEDMGRGMVFSTDDDPLPEEEKKEQPARTMITTNTFKE